ncbi:uncharacterized protein LOC144473774, partial [Augochlora pura]
LCARGVPHSHLKGSYLLSSYNCCANVKKQRTYKNWSLQDKLEAVNKIDAGASIRAIAIEYNVHESVVRKWIRDRETLEKHSLSTYSKRVRLSPVEKVNKALTVWFYDEKKRKNSISISDVKAKALELFKEFGGMETFKASDGWFRHWKQKNGIRFVATSEGHLSKNSEEVDQFKKEIAKLIKTEQVTLDQIFNADITELYFKMMPDETSVIKTEHSFPRYNKIKERLTLLTCCNANGSLKIPLLVIGHYPKPRVRKDLASRLSPVIYINETNACLSTTIFERWFNHFALTDVFSRDVDTVRIRSQTRYHATNCRFRGATDVYTRDTMPFVRCHGRVNTRADQNNNENQKAKKIQPVIDMLIHRFQMAYRPRQHIAVDESLLLWKGRLSFKQYICSKRARFGLKSFILAESETGYVYNLKLYSGRELDGRKSTLLGKSGAIVMDLSRNLLNEGRIIYLDNWYTSPALFEKLCQYKTHACGTVRMNRKGLPCDEKVKNIKSLNKSEMLVRYNRFMVFCVWKDKRPVSVLSTLHTPQLVTTEKIDYSTGQYIKKPNIILDYNIHMGAVNYTDQILHGYESYRKTLKWYKKYFFYLLDIAICNSLAIWNCLHEKKKSIHEVKEDLILGLLEKYHNPKKNCYQKGKRNYLHPLRLHSRCFLKKLPPTNTKNHPMRRCSEGVKEQFIPNVRTFLNSRGLPKKAIILLDNTKSHSLTDVLTVNGIRAIFFPSNVIPIIPPLHQGIIEAIKRRYKTKLLAFVINAQAEGIEYNGAIRSFNIKHAIDLISESWDDITEEIIYNCWKPLLNMPVKIDDSIDHFNSEYIHEICKKISYYENITLEQINKWIHADSQPILTDKKIIETIENPFNDEIVIFFTVDMKNDQQIQNEISPLKAVESLDCVISFLKKNEEISPSDMETLKRIKERLLKMRNNI